MTAAARYLVCIVSVLFGAMSEVRADEYASKLVLRTGIGVLNNKGSQGGGTTSAGGFSLSFHNYLNDFLSVGFGYQSQFDLSAGTIPISGYDIIGRVYLNGSGTRVTYQNNLGKFEYRQKRSYYLVSYFGDRKFFFGEDLESNEPTKQLTGEYGVVNFGAGIDHTYFKNIEINLEVSTSLFTLSSSDPRVKVSEVIMWGGLNYVF